MRFLLYSTAQPYRMALTRMVYVGGLTSLREARYCAGMGAELLGFALDARAPGHVAPAAFADITGRLSGVRTVGEVGALSAAEVAALRPAYPTDCLLTEDPTQVAALAMLNCPLLLRMPLRPLLVPQQVGVICAP